MAWAKLCVMNLIDTFPRGLKRQRRRRARKRDVKHLRSEFALLETLSRLFHLVQVLKTSLGNLFWSSILKDCIEVQEKKKEVAVSCSRPWQKVKLGVFGRKKWIVQTRVIHVHSWCFAYLNLLLFCCSRRRRRRWCSISLLKCRNAVSNIV